MSERAAESHRLRRDCGLTYRAIGERMGVSASRIPQLIAQHLNNTRGHPGFEGLPTRAALTLMRSGFKAGSETRHATDEQLRAIPNLGRLMLAQIRQAFPVTEGDQ